MPGGTEPSASSVSVAIVGTIMTARMIEAVSVPKPIPPVISATMGRRITSPKKPYTTEGTPASISTAGRTIARILGDAISERKTAVPMASGAPSTSDPMVMASVPTTSGMMPNRPSVADHSLPPRNATRPGSFTTSHPRAMVKTKMSATAATATTAQTRNRFLRSASRR